MNSLGREKYLDCFVSNNQIIAIGHDFTVVNDETTKSFNLPLYNNEWLLTNSFSLSGFITQTNIFSAATDNGGDITDEETPLLIDNTFADLIKTLVIVSSGDTIERMEYYNTFTEIGRRFIKGKEPTINDMLDILEGGTPDSYKYDTGTSLDYNSVYPFFHRLRSSFIGQFSSENYVPGLILKGKKLLVTFCKYPLILATFMGTYTNAIDPVTTQQYVITDPPTFNYTLSKLQLNYRIIYPTSQLQNLLNSSINMKLYKINTYDVYTQLINVSAHNIGTVLSLPISFDFLLNRSAVTSLDFVLLPPTNYIFGRKVGNMPGNFSNVNIKYNNENLLEPIDSDMYPNFLLNETYFNRDSNMNVKNLSSSGLFSIDLIPSQGYNAGFVDDFKDYTTAYLSNYIGSTIISVRIKKRFINNEEFENITDTNGAKISFKATIRNDSVTTSSLATSISQNMTLLVIAHYDSYYYYNDGIEKVVA